MTGWIRSLASSYGFIRSDETKLDLFFLADSVVGALDFEHLVVGDAVQFEEMVPPHPKGRRAVDVAWIQPPESFEEVR